MSRRQIQHMAIHEYACKNDITQIEKGDKSTKRNLKITMNYKCHKT